MDWKWIQLRGSCFSFDMLVITYISKSVPYFLPKMWYKNESVKVCKSKWTLKNVSVNGAIEVNLVNKHMTST